MDMINQRKLRTLLVDDEALSRRGLELRLRMAADVEIIGKRPSQVTIQRILRCRPEGFWERSFQIAEESHQWRMMLVKLPVYGFRFIESRDQNLADDTPLFIAEE